MNVRAIRRAQPDRIAALACLVLGALPTLASAQGMSDPGMYEGYRTAQIDATIPFAPGAEIKPQDFRGVLGSVDYQQGRLETLFYRFDETGSARFSISPLFDRDVWQVECSIDNGECLMRYGPVIMSLDKTGRSAFLVAGASGNLDLRFSNDMTMSIEANGEPVSLYGDQLKELVTIRQDNTAVPSIIATDGINDVIAYMTWVLTGQNPPPPLAPDLTPLTDKKGFDDIGDKPMESEAPVKTVSSGNGAPKAAAPAPAPAVEAKPAASPSADVFLSSMMDLFRETLSLTRELALKSMDKPQETEAAQAPAATDEELQASPVPTLTFSETFPPNAFAQHQGDALQSNPIALPNLPQPLIPPQQPVATDPSQHQAPMNGMPSHQMTQYAPAIAPQSMDFGFQQYGQMQTGMNPPSAFQPTQPFNMQMVLPTQQNVVQPQQGYTDGWSPEGSGYPQFAPNHGSATTWQNAPEHGQMPFQQTTTFGTIPDLSHQTSWSQDSQTSFGDQNYQNVPPDTDPIIDAIQSLTLKMDNFMERSRQAEQARNDFSVAALHRAESIDQVVMPSESNHQSGQTQALSVESYAETEHLTSSRVSSLSQRIGHLRGQLARHPDDSPVKPSPTTQQVVPVPIIASYDHQSETAALTALDDSDSMSFTGPAADTHVREVPVIDSRELSQLKDALVDIGIADQGGSTSLSPDELRQVLKLLDIPGFEWQRLSMAEITKLLGELAQ